jgi:hypothetical protein
MRYLLTAFTLCCVFASSVKADVISYGNFFGTGVSFRNVSESSSSIPTLASNLYGTPVVMGNMLIFSPLQFEASQTGPGIERVDGQLNVDVVANPGNVISSVTIEEFGDYAIAVPFAGSQGGFVSATLNAFAVTSSGVYDDADQFLAATPTPPGIPTAPWGVAPDPMVVDLQGWRPTSEVGLRVDNRLTAASFSQFDDSFIKKKGFKITVNFIPEPTSALLILVCGVAGLPLYRRR